MSQIEAQMINSGANVCVSTLKLKLFCIETTYSKSVYGTVLSLSDLYLQFSRSMMVTYAH